MTNELKQKDTRQKERVLREERKKDTQLEKTTELIKTKKK